MDIIYIRTSTEEQEPHNQITPCKLLFPDNENIILLDKQSAFTDNKERENFEKAKKLIKLGKIKNFIVWDLDRIYRNRIKLKQFFEFCNLYHVAILSVNQKWLEQLTKIPAPFNDIMHELMLNLMGWLAEDESKKKSERVKLSIKKKNGNTFSYKGNKWGRKSLSTKTKGEVIELYKKGYSFRRISSMVVYWDKNNNKKNISKSAVHKIITEISSEMN